MAKRRIVRYYGDQWYYVQKKSWICPFWHDEIIWDGEYDTHFVASFDLYFDAVSHIERQNPNQKSFHQVYELPWFHP